MILQKLKNIIIVLLKVMTAIADNDVKANFITYIFKLGVTRII